VYVNNAKGAHCFFSIATMATLRGQKVTLLRTLLFLLLYERGEFTLIKERLVYKGCRDADLPDILRKLELNI
jgi:hypothetical protein